MPMRLFVFYTSKLNPKNENLWQKPKKKVNGDDPVWYDNQVVGKHPPENFLAILSEKIPFSTRYINRSV